MINWQIISERISDATGARFLIARSSPVGGGCINQAWHIEGNDGRHYFVKLNAADRAAMFAAERAGLEALTATHTVRVPLPVTHGRFDEHAFLVLEYFSVRNHGKAGLLGEQLAALHRVQANQFGWEQDNTIGLTTQRNARTADWLRFWGDQRLCFQLDLAARNGYRGKLQTLGQRLQEKLPDLLAGHHPAPSLLHGDLWGGNYAYLADGAPLVFDPAPYYGDRETDLAMTELFGGFEPEFYAAYQAAYPLETGYATRKTLYNLYHILNHCNMFGDGYVPQAEGMMRRLLKELPYGSAE